MEITEAWEKAYDIFMDEARGTYEEEVIAYTEELMQALKPKMGHWIMPVQDDGTSEPILYQIRCSQCGFDLDPQTWYIELHQYGADRYCPACGAVMMRVEK